MIKLKKRRFNMGLGSVVKCPDTLDLMNTCACSHLDDAEEMYSYNCTEPLPDDSIILQQESLLCLPPKRHSDCLDIIAVPHQDRMTFVIIEDDRFISLEGEVIDRELIDIARLRKLFPKHEYKLPLFTGPFEASDPENELSIESLLEE